MRRIMVLGGGFAGVKCVQTLSRALSRNGPEIVVFKAENRMEALNKDFGSRLLVSARVRQTTEVNGAKQVAPVQVRGRDEIIEVYHVA